MFKKTTGFVLILLYIPNVFAEVDKVFWCKNPNINYYNYLKTELVSEFNYIPKAQRLVRTEGLMSDNPVYKRSKYAQTDFKLIRNLTIAYQISLDSKYIELIEKILYSWADIYEISYNPIDETKFESYIEAYIVTKNKLSENTKSKINTFLAKMLHGYLKLMEELILSKSSKYTNWNSHRIKLIAYLSVALEDKDSLERATNLYSIHLNNHIFSDGSIYDFYTRDSLHYVVYSLDQLLLASLAVKELNHDWYSIRGTHGAGLREAIKWLEPYALGIKQHNEFVNTTINFDRIRRDAGLKGFSGTWNRNESKRTIYLASLLDKTFEYGLDYKFENDSLISKICYRLSLH